MKRPSSQSLDSHGQKASWGRPAGRRQEHILFSILAGPALLWYSAVMAWPLFNMFINSLQRWHGIAKKSEFVGMDNYTRLFRQDPRFVTALVNTVKYTFIALPIILLLSFVLGFFLSRRPPGYRLFRVVFFTPSILSASAQALLFLGLYLPDGIINNVLGWIGLESLKRVWLADCSTALYSVIAIEVWSAVGFYAVLFYAALSNTPEDCYDAALIDGANIWQFMWRVMFPLHLGFFGVVAMLCFLWTLSSGQLVLLLTKGGPGNCSLTLGYYLYEQAFRYRYLGYSQAIGVFVFLIGLMGMYAIRAATRRDYF
jgi:multiple sugar transport system permease protein